jgi:hypothetical protein
MVSVKKSRETMGWGWAKSHGILFSNQNSWNIWNNWMFKPLKMAIAIDP